MERGEATWVQLSRGAAAELDLAPGDPVWISRTRTVREDQVPDRDPERSLDATGDTVGAL